MNHELPHVLGTHMESFSDNIKTLIDKINRNVLCSISEQNEDFIHHSFKKVTRLLHHFNQNSCDEKDYQSIIDFIGKIFIVFPFKKVYNIETLKNAGLFVQKSPEEQFFNNVSIFGTQADHLPKGGSCSLWCLFFFNYLGQFQNIFKNIHIISYKPTFQHSAVICEINGVMYIIDPFNKETNIIKPLEMENNIYLGTVRNKAIYGEIQNISPLTFQYNNKIYNTTTYFDSEIFLKSIEIPQGTVAQIRTYIGEEKTDLYIKKLADNERFMLQFNEKHKTGYLESLSIDLKFLENPSTYNILLLFFKGICLSENELKQLQYLSLLIDKKNLLSTIKASV